MLIIRHANPEDQDVYICSAENSAGAVHASAQVQVNCKYLLFCKKVFDVLELFSCLKAHVLFPC